MDLRAAISNGLLEYWKESVDAIFLLTVIDGYSTIRE